MDTFLLVITVAATLVLVATVRVYERIVDDLRAEVDELRDEIGEAGLLLELASTRHPSNVRRLHLADPA